MTFLLCLALVNVVDFYLSACCVLVSLFAMLCHCSVIYGLGLRLSAESLNSFDSNSVTSSQHCELQYGSFLSSYCSNHCRQFRRSRSLTLLCPLQDLAMKFGVMCCRGFTVSASGL